MAISLVQSNAQTSTGSVTSFAVTLPSAVARGNLIVVHLAVGVEPITVSLPDSSWKQAVLQQSTGNTGAPQITIAYLIVDAAHAGQTSWTFSLSAKHTVFTIAREWNTTFGWQASPVDKTSSGPAVAASATLMDTGTTATTAQASELWVGAFAYKGSPLTESGLTGSWTLGLETYQTSDTVLRDVYQIASATGAADAQLTLSSAALWGAALATFIPNPNIEVIASLSGQGALNATITPQSPPPPFLPTTKPVSASYIVRVRGPNKLPQGEITTYRNLSIVRRFNNVSDWAIDLDADDPVASLLVQPGYGLTVTRSIYNPNTGQVVSTRVEITGPMVGLQRKMSDNSLTVHGKDDMIFVAGMEAWPVTDNYWTQLQNGALGPAAMHLYKLSEAAGATTFADTGTGTTANLTKNGAAFTSGGAPIMDIDPTVGAAVTGARVASTVEDLSVSGPAGMPTGAGSWWMEGWCKPIDSATGIFEVLMGYGQLSSGTRTGAAVNLNNGVASINVNGGTAVGSFSYTIGTLYHFLAYYDGTNWNFYVNGTLNATGTGGGAMAIPSSSVGLVAGAAPWDGTASFNSPMQSIAFGTGAITAGNALARYNLGVNRFASASNDVQTTQDAETVLKHYVSVNGGPSGGMPERIISGLSMEANSHRGQTVSDTARFEKLVALDGSGMLQRIALNGGDIGFKVATVSGAMTFSVYVPHDRTGSIIFSQALGNILDFTYGREAPDPFTGGNVQVVGGSGAGTARAFTVVPDSGSLATWWRFEAFVDARDTADPKTMLSRGQAALDETRETFSYDVILAPETLQMVYGIDFDLGDKVTAIIDGAPYQDLIREVDIDLKPGAAEVVTPKMGTPNATRIKDALMRYVRQARRQDSALKKTQAAQ